MKVAYVVTEVSGVSFYRMWQPAMRLRKMGHKTALLWYKHDQPFRPDWEWRMDELPDVRRDLDMACYWADVVVWAALHTPDSLQFLEDVRVKYPQKPFLLELDDTVFDIPAYNRGSMAYFPGSDLAKIILRQIELSDGLIVSTPFLAERMGKYGKPVAVVPNCIDLSLWRRRIFSPRRRRLTIGWMGGATHEADLKLLDDVIPRILEKHPNVRFKFIHGCPEFLKHKPGCEWIDTNDPRYSKLEKCWKCGGRDGVEWTHEWRTIDKYPAWISGQDIDIGVAPLIDNQFNRAKSNLRWLEFSAMGVPTVASPVENFTRSIKDGVTGLFASTPEEWGQRLSRLIMDFDLRATIGENALNEVRANWNVKLQANKYLSVLKEFSHGSHDKIGASNDGGAANRRPQPSNLDGSASPIAA